MKIYESTVIEMNKSIAGQFEGVYDKYLKSHMSIEFDAYLNQVLAGTWDELRNLMEVTNETLLSVGKRREEMKRRWLTKELDTKIQSGLQKEVELLQYTYIKTKEKDASHFELITGEKTLDKAIAKIEKSLRDWRKDKDALICNFPYIEHKTFRQIEKALAHDARYFIIKKMKETYPTGEQETIISIPSSITQVPYDHTNRMKINQLNQQGNYFNTTYYINDKTRFESRIDVQALQEGLMQENLKQLNSKDQEILLYLMSLKDEALYQPLPMVVEIGEIVRNVYDTDGKKNYDSVKESLIKMDFMELRVIDESTMRMTKVSLFHKVDIGMDEITEKESARIIFSEDLINEFVKNQTVNIYKDIIDKFTMNATKVLIYPLQRQRIYSASIERDGENILFNTNISFFRGALVFGKSRRTKQLKVIEDALNEIIKNKITLKSYVRKGDNFLLEFYPFTEKEKRDLLSNNAPEKFLLNRSNLTVE